MRAVLVFLLCLCAVHAEPWRVVPVERVKAFMGKMNALIAERVNDVTMRIAEATGRVKPAVGELDDLIAQDLARGVANDYENDFRAFAAGLGIKVPTTYPVYEATGGIGSQFPLHCADLRYGRVVMERFAELWTETLQRHTSLDLQSPDELVGYVITPIAHVLCKTHHEEGLLSALVDFTHRSAMFAAVAKAQ